jgi:Cdc6-like AAA superfamily ATPase
MDQSRRQADMARGRIQTAQSFLQSSTFHNWLNSSQETLFCPGMPGAGKSMLASMIIDELRSRRLACTPSNRIGVAFVYCDFREEYGAEDFLSSIAKQLCFEQPLALLHVKDLHALCNQEDRLPTADDLTKLLRSIFSLYPRSYIVIDALDEWNRACCGKLLQHIFNLQTDCQMNFLATSRHIPWIDAFFSNAKRADVSASEPDVASYVYSRMNEFPEFVINDPQLQDEMKIEIARAVDGM